MIKPNVSPNEIESGFIVHAPIGFRGDRCGAYERLGDLEVCLLMMRYCQSEVYVF